jgi:1,4-alpha-glucan branching enzyme
MPAEALDPKLVLKRDGYLEPNIPAIVHRHDVFRKWKDTIEQHEGGYDNFTKGYLKFGLNVGSNGEVVYREWAPNAIGAYLIGDFSRCHLGAIHLRGFNVLQTNGAGRPIP